MRSGTPSGRSKKTRCSTSAAIIKSKRRGYRERVHVATPALISRSVGLRTALVALALQFALMGCGALVPTGPAFSVSLLSALPPLTTDAPADGRDAGFSARIGDRVAWLFGDTFPNDDIMLSATAAWSAREDPTRLWEPTDASGIPVELYAYSPREAAYNAAHAEPPICCSQYATCPSGDPYCACAQGTDCGARIALWPGAVVVRDARSLVGYYEKVRVGAGPWDFDVLGVGTATLDADSTRAVRALGADGEPMMVFEHGEPKFLHALRVDQDAVSWVYVYGETEPSNCGVDVYVGRVALENISDRAAYRFFDGRAWTDSIVSAGPIMTAVVGGLGSVSWNDYLGAYVSGTLGPCTEGGQFLLRSARRPEGPWSKAVAVDLASIGADEQAYAGLMHSSLARGQRVVVSFYQPLVRDDRALGRVHLAEIEFHRHRPLNRYRGRR